MASSTSLSSSGAAAAASSTLFEEILVNIDEPEKSIYRTFFETQRITRAKLSVVDEDFLRGNGFTAIDAKVVMANIKRLTATPERSSLSTSTSTSTSTPTGGTCTIKVMDSSTFVREEIILPEPTHQELSRALAKPGYTVQLYSNSMIICDSNTVPVVESVSHQTIFYDLIPNACRDTRYKMNRKSLSETLHVDGHWRPNVQQTELALSTLLASLYHLPEHFAANNTTIDLFLAHLQLISPFPPLTTAMRHLYGGRLLNAEKHLISQTFYSWIRKLMPNALVADDSILLYTPHLLVHLISEIDATVVPQELFASFVVSIVKIDCLDTDVTDPVSIEYVKGAVFDRTHVDYLLGCIAKTQIDHVGSYFTEQDVFPCMPEFRALLQTISKGARAHLIDKAFEYNISMNEPREVVPWKANKWKELHNSLMVSYDSWCFKEASKCTLGETALAIVKGQQHNHVAFVYGAMKNDIDSLNVFCPSTGQESVQKQEFATEDDMEQYSRAYPYFPYRTKGIKTSSRQLPPPASLIQQATVIALDLSYSMRDPAFRNDKTATALDVAQMLIPSFVERCAAYGYNQLLSLVVFATLVRQHTEFDRNTEKFLEDFRNKPFEDVNARSTALYKAILYSMDMLLAYVEQEREKFVRMPHLRILCVTDGEDNGSRDLPPERTVQLLQQNNITLDIIPLGQTNRILPAMARATGGLYYEFTSSQQAVELFQREAIVMLSERSVQPIRQVRSRADLESYLREYQPVQQAIQRPTPPQLMATAIPVIQTSVPPAAGHGALDRTHRVMRDIRELHRKPVFGVSIFVTEHDMFFWKAVVKGPDGTNYAGGHFLVHVTFPDLYPTKPPVVRFQTPVYHCNINDDGRVCHGIFDRGWGVGISMVNIFEAVRDLLTEPNADDALDSVKGDLFRTNRAAYDLKCREYVMAHATKSFEELKTEYALE